jgi:hypothetical protein
MKSRILLAGLAVTFLLAVASAGEFEWPREGTVKLNNRIIAVSWRDGRPIAQRREVFRDLRLPKEGEEDVDLVAELAKLKTKITQKGELIDVLVVQELTGSRTPATGGQAAQFKAEFEKAQYDKKMAPKLVVVQSNVFIDTDTDFIHGKGTIQNQGGSASDWCWAMGNFVDWYGHPFAKPDPWPLRSLAPGESKSFEFWSHVQKDDKKLEKGSKYRCDITFQKATPPEIEAAIARLKNY